MEIHYDIYVCMVLYACVSVLSSELQLESHLQSSGLETEPVDTTIWRREWPMVCCANLTL